MSWDNLFLRGGGCSCFFVFFGFVFPFVSFLRIIKEGLAEKVTFEKMLVEDERLSLGDHL